MPVNQLKKYLDEKHVKYFSQSKVKPGKINQHSKLWLRPLNPGCDALLQHPNITNLPCDLDHAHNTQFVSRRKGLNT